MNPGWGRTGWTKLPEPGAICSNNFSGWRGSDAVIRYGAVGFSEGSQEILAVADHYVPRAPGHAHRPDGGFRRGSLYLHVVLETKAPAMKVATSAAADGLPSPAVPLNWKIIEPRTGVFPVGAGEVWRYRELLY